MEVTFKTLTTSDLNQIYLILVLTLSLRVGEMNIIKLPDDCLLLIFNLLNDFGTLMNCASVCKKWKDLVSVRLRRVNYLTDTYLARDGYPASYTMFFVEDGRVKLSRISKLLPRLKILELRRTHGLDCLSNWEVKGLQLLSYPGQLDNITMDIPSVEMIAASHFYNFFANDIQGPKLTQLFISLCDVSKFASYAQYFPNLKRLHIANFKLVRPGYSEKCYNGPVLENLKILEISLSCEYADLFNRFTKSPVTYYGFSLADHCPALKSAFHAIESREPFVNSEIKNYVLEDLVLCCEGYCFDWPIFRRILSKYPNLKHLAIAGYTKISDENIPDILELLPRITLIDINKSVKVTEKSAEYIDRYSDHHKRSISFYYRNNRAEITKKWPHLSFVSIGREFNFMKYCFFSPYEGLPLLLDSDE